MIHEPLRWADLGGPGRQPGRGQPRRRVTVDPGALPWLLLAGAGTAGAHGDRLAATTFIQRIDTVGGLAPDPAGCTAATAGARQEVPYTADYVLWKAAGGA